MSDEPRPTFEWYTRFTAALSTSQADLIVSTICLPNVRVLNGD